MHDCFVDLEKAYDRILRDKLWAVLLQYGIIDGQLLTGITVSHCTNVHASMVYVRVNSVTNADLGIMCGATARLLSFTYSVPYLYGRNS